MIYRFASLLALVAVAATAAFAQEAAQQTAPPAEKAVVLEVGDEAPEFEAVDQAGEPWKSVEHVGKKILVVYFYPKDMTGGCTKQGQCYRDAKDELEGLGVEVVGVSGDTVESHQEFIKKENLNFTLLADPEGRVAREFGVKRLNAAGPFVTARWTFVIDEEGHIAYKDDDVDAANDVTNVLKVVAKLKEKA